MISLENNLKCSGCGSCVNICPVNAINLIPDESGFLYPDIDKNKCINCSQCNKVCQIDERIENESFNQKFYALINKNADYLKVSSSGGAFLAVAELVFNMGGVVFGCAFDDNQKAYHTISYSLNECIEKHCGSKYVQSETRYTYREVKKHLQDGKVVLYVGTPCQIEGLKLFLKSKTDNLITLDLICHGVSSPALWNLHKNYLENKVNAKINRYRFRGKENVGWALYYYYYYGDKNKCKKGPSILDRYYTDFLKGVNYRESCYNCSFANLNRTGDITIGDFWGAEKYIKDINIRNGVSLVIINSDKGKEILDKIKNNIELIEVSKEQATKENGNLTKPTTRPSERDDYYKKCYDDFAKWENDYFNSKNWKIAKIKSMIPSFIKKVIRRG